MNQIDKINMDQITKQMSPKLGIDPLVIKNVLARIGLDVVFNEAERLKSSDNFSLMANKSNLSEKDLEEIRNQPTDFEYFKKAWDQILSESQFTN